MFAIEWNVPGSELQVRLLWSHYKSGINNALDGSEDDILYEESDASSKNNHEGDFSGSDDFLDFCVK
jgi:hypothetical protein